MDPHSRFVKPEGSFLFADFGPMRDGTQHAVEICNFVSNLYDKPVLFASDLHKDCAAVIDFLLTFVRPWEWAFVSLGDMAGTDEFGSDGDPTEEYKRVHRSFRKFYFVDGNHDRPRERAYLLTNSDGSSCSLEGSPGSLGSALVSGVSGIMSGRDVPGRVSKPVFEQRVTAALETRDVHTLATHDTPRVSGFQPEIGNSLLAEYVLTYEPVVHAFGHCHLCPAILQAGRTTFINADRRVVMLQPVNPPDPPP
jgi:Icc-related predicted phosphoesterase